LFESRQNNVEPDFSVQKAQAIIKVTQKYREKSADSNGIKKSI